MPIDTTQGRDISSIIKEEAPDYLSRDKVTVLAGQDLAIGTVIGKVTAGSVPTSGTLTAIGSENGTCTVVTGGKNTKVGTYTITCTAVVSHGGVFEVTGVNGEHLGTVTVGPGAGLTGVFTSDQINFTLTDGSTDFALGSKFTVAVPAGGGQVRALNLTGVDGSRNAVGILGPYAIDASASGEETLAYTSGGTYEIMPGDIITGNTGGAYARVVAITLTSGTFAAGTAAGTMTLDGVSGTFQSENLNVGANSNVATIGGDSSAVSAADTAGVMYARNCQYVDDYLVWPTGATAAQKATAKAELAALGIIERDQA
jgi:hypothetical protein